MSDWLELWCLLANNQYPHKIGMLDNFEDVVQRMINQSASIKRDDNYFVVRVSHSTDI